MNSAMRIDAETAARVKATVPAAAFYAKELGRNIPDRPGWHDAGICPFHNDRHAGSFKVHLPDGRFKCFACDAGGDIIAFAERRYDLSFQQAVEALARAWGISV